MMGFVAGFQIAVPSRSSGIELVGTTAAEAKDPERNAAASAINSIPGARHACSTSPALIASSWPSRRGATIGAGQTQPVRGACSSLAGLAARGGRWSTSWC
jgi:hypothetical protein